MYGFTENIPSHYSSQLLIAKNGCSLGFTAILPRSKILRTSVSKPWALAVALLLSSYGKRGSEMKEKGQNWFNQNAEIRP